MILVNILNFTSPDLAGAGVVARNILGAWLAREERPVIVYQDSQVDAHATFAIPHRKGIHMKKVSLSSVVSRIFFEQILLPFKLRGVKVYYSPTPVMPFLAKIISPRTKIVITIHDMIPFFVKSKYGKMRTLYVKFISKYGARLADAVLTVSENSKKDVINITGIDSGKVHVVYNFISSPPTVPDVQDEKFFLSISTVEPGKNIENTLAGFKLFREKCRLMDFKFYWIGRIGWGYTAEQLRQLVDQNGLKDCFEFLGFVDEERKNSLLQSCTALVYLSHYEGFGLPVLEGLYFNKPSIVSETSSLPEVIGQAGILCDKDNVSAIADAMHLMIENLDTYQEKIPTQLQKFDKDRQMAKFLAVVSI